MRSILIPAACALGLFAPSLSYGQQPIDRQPRRNFVVVKKGEPADEIVRKAANVIPSDRQLAWHEREFIAFTHFGMDTFTDREWGEGTESPSLFNPTDFDARQWAKLIKNAGMKMLILTAKHHDGFCLWPSKYTEHSVKNCPWRGGKGDVVREVANACREAGLKFGVYLSPWDRHERTYGDSPAYNEHYRNQLRELLSNYGEVSEVWFDGACGEGPNGRKQVYDWQSYYKVVRELQPNAVIFGMGPDIRWVGTESGYGRETEWCPIRFDPGAADEIPTDTEESSVDNLFTPRDLTSPDLGSREKINDARFLMWYPSEADVSIRPGWFYHQIEDTGVKTPEKLVDIYFSSVGRNSVLLLNIPPDRRGLIHENDIQSLKGMKKILDQTFAENLAVGAKVRASCEGKGHEASHVIDRNRNTYWITRDGVESASLEFDLHGKKTFDCAMLQENISLGQRVEKFCLETWDGTNWIQFGSGTTIGYKRLLRFPAVTTSKVRLVIEQSRTCPSISNFGLFKFPPQVSFLPDGGAFVDSVEVSISTESKDAVIHYTLDGGVPSKRSPFYAKPIKLTQPSIITAIALSKHGVESLPKAATFVKANHGITLNTRYEESYSGGGALALVDGLFGSTDFRDGRWQGYEGVDLDAEIDLGTSMPIYKISARFLQNVESWIFLPKSVEYATSDNGKDFDIVASITNSVYERKEGSIVEPFEKVLESKSGRYVRVRAKNMGICPSWHAGAGGKAWIFVDEVVVN